jgi:hypothetical protein
MEMHVEALFAHDPAGRLLHVNEPGSGRAPRFFLGLTGDGLVVRFRNDVDAQLERALERAAASLRPGRDAAQRPIDPEPFRAVLAGAAPVEKTWAGPAFAFPGAMPITPAVVPVTGQNADCLQPLLDNWSGDVASCQPMLALIIDGRAVSLCCSVRKTNRAHEAGVETAPSMRGRGYAPMVVSRWARAVRAEGAVPLYSTSWQNQASRSVARKLDLVPVGSDLHIT